MSVAGTNLGIAPIGTVGIVTAVEKQVTMNEVIERVFLVLSIGDAKYYLFPMNSEAQATNFFSKLKHKLVVVQLNVAHQVLFLSEPRIGEL